MSKRYKILQGKFLTSNDIHVGYDAYEGAGAEEYESLQKAIKRSLKTPGSVPRDLKLDDGDIKELPNFYRWCKKGLPDGYRPFAKQLAIGLKLFADYCPRCSRPKFLKDIRNIPVDMPIEEFPENIQFLKFGRCPACKAKRSDLVKSRELNFYNTFAFCSGQRSGKSILTGMLFSYQLHKMLKMQRPNETFGFAPNTLLTANFVGLNFAGVLDLLWKPIKSILDESPWFQQYNSMLKAHSEQLGIELYKNMDTYIEYPRSHLKIYPAVPNKDTLRGRTRFAYAIDEIGLMDAERNELITKSANEIFKSMENSLLNVRRATHQLIDVMGEDNIISGMGYNISSPKHQRDKIMTLVRKNARSRIVMAVHTATWEVNPNVPRNSREVRQAYKDDPIAAERDYGANPPATENPFFTDQDAITACFGKESNQVKYTYTTTAKADDSGVETKRWATINSVVKKRIRKPAILTLDAGEKNNAFGLSVMTMNLHPATKVIHYNVEALIEISPETAQHRLNFTQIVKHVIYPLIEEFNVVGMISDRWQSSKLHTDVSAQYPRIFTQHYTLRYEDFKLVRNAVTDGSLLLPRLEMEPKEILNADKYPDNFRYKPAAHLWLQFNTVRDGVTTVAKGHHTTDDLFRTIALGMHFLNDPKFVKKYMRNALKIGSSSGIVAGGGFSGGDITKPGTPRIISSSAAVAGGRSTMPMTHMTSHGVFTPTRS